MQTQQIPMNRAARRRVEKRVAKSKFSAAKRKALADKSGLSKAGIDANLLTDVELTQIRRILETTEREAERAFEVVQKTNDLPFSDPANFPRIAMVFQPIERILDELCATGYIDSDDTGAPLLFNKDDGVWYPMVPALESMCDTYSKMASVYGWEDHTDGMRKLAKRLQLEMPVFQTDVDRARETIAWMKETILTITPNQFSAECVEVQVRDELRAAGVVPR
jgi:hypothetical protein